MRTRHLAGALFTNLLFCLSGIGFTHADAASQEGGSVPMGGPVMLAAACFNCHGTDGRLASSGIPAIAGVPRAVLQAQLLAFKQGEIPNTTVMDRIAAGFSDAELAVLAGYFAEQSASLATPADTGESVPSGQDR